MRSCTVCSWPPRTVGAVNKCLLAGMSVAAVARKYNKPQRPISQSAIRRHSLHILSSTGSRNALPGPDVASVSGKSLLHRIEELIKKHEGLATTATETGQIIAAVAALREIRASFELLAKLSGELSTANINFFAMDFSESRIQSLVEAVALQGPDVRNLMRDLVAAKLGVVAPSFTVNFVDPPARDGLPGRMLEGSVPPKHEALVTCTKVV